MYKRQQKNSSRALRAHGCFTLHAERSSVKVYMFTSLATKRGLAAEKSQKNSSRALRAHGRVTLHAERSRMKVYMFIYIYMNGHEHTEATLDTGH